MRIRDGIAFSGRFFIIIFNWVLLMNFFAAGQQQGVIELIRSFDTAGPFNTDTPAGVGYHPPSDHLYISDSEINQGGEWNCENIFEVTRLGDQLIATYDAYAFGGNHCPPTSNSDFREPTGIAFLNGYFYITDDNEGIVMKHDSSFGEPLLQVDTDHTDAEGVTCDPDNDLIYVLIAKVSSGQPGKVQVFDPDLNHLSSLTFMLPSVMYDPEGIAFSRLSGHLFLVSTPDMRIYEVDTGGTLLKYFDLTSFIPSNGTPQGLTFAPSSDPNDDPNLYNIYIADGRNRIYEARIEGEDIPLPVSLAAFTAAPGDGEVTLEWMTESEINNLGFIIERAYADAGPYAEVASYRSHPELEGQGNSNRRHSYSFTDTALQNGVLYYYRLVDVDFSGNRTYHGPLTITPEAARAASQIRLYPNYPNPFNPATTIAFEVPDNGGNGVRVDLTIFDMLGKEVNKLLQEELSGGRYEIQWDGRDDSGKRLPSGIYLARVQAGNYSSIQKMMLVR